MSLPENKRERTPALLEIAADHRGAATQRQAGVFEFKPLIFQGENRRVETIGKRVARGSSNGRFIVASAIDPYIAAMKIKLTEKQSNWAAAAVMRCRKLEFLL